MITFPAGIICDTCGASEMVTVEWCGRANGWHPKIPAGWKLSRGYPEYGFPTKCKCLKCFEAAKEEVKP